MISKEELAKILGDHKTWISSGGSSGARANLADAYLAGAIPFSFSPGTLGVALQAEAGGRGHVEFRDGIPVWTTAPARFPIVVEVAS